MKSNELGQADFVLLGSYPPREAAKLLERFHQAGIAFRTQPRSPPPEPRPTVVIDISVDSSRASEVAQIHCDLLGMDRRIITHLSFLSIATSSQSMHPTAPLRYNFSVFATTPCSGLSRSR